MFGAISSPCIATKNGDFALAFRLNIEINIALSRFNIARALYTKRANLWFRCESIYANVVRILGRTNILQEEPKNFSVPRLLIYHYEWSAATYEVVRPTPSRNRSSVREVLRRCSIDDTVRTLDCDASSLTSVRVVFSRIGQPRARTACSSSVLLRKSCQLAKADLERSFSELPGVSKYTIDRYTYIYIYIWYCFAV